MSLQFVAHDRHVNSRMRGRPLTRTIAVAPHFADPKGMEGCRILAPDKTAGSVTT